MHGSREQKVEDGTAEAWGVRDEPHPNLKHRIRDAVGGETICGDEVHGSRENKAGRLNKGEPGIRGVERSVQC